MKITGIVAALLWDMKFYFGTGQELTKRATADTVYSLSLVDRSESVGSNILGWKSNLPMCLVQNIPQTV